MLGGFPRTKFYGLLIGIVLCMSVHVEPLFARTVLKIHSQSGDWVGQGRRYQLGPAHGQFKVSRKEIFGILKEDTIRIEFEHHDRALGRDWWIDFDMSRQGVQEKLYDGAIRLVTAIKTPRPGMSLSSGWLSRGYLRGCNVLSGKFLLLEHVVNQKTGEIERLAIDFEQHCEHRPAALFGAFRYKSDVAIRPRISVSDLIARKGNRRKSTTQLSFSLSLPSTEVEEAVFRPRDDTARLTRDYSLRPGRVIFPAGVTEVTKPLEIRGSLVPVGDREFSVNLRASSNSLLGDSHAKVTIRDPNRPMTIVVLQSHPGDLLGKGRSWSYTPSDSRFDLTPTNSQWVFGQDHGGTTTRFNIADNPVTFRTRLRPGRYMNVERHSNRKLGIHGMGVTVRSSACNTISGYFAVGQVKYNSENFPERLSLDFRQHCDKRRPALFGAIRINSMLRQASITDAVTENDYAEFLVTLNPPAQGKQSVAFETVDGTARVGIDYEAVKTQVTFAPGQAVRVVRVPILPGAKPNRYFYGKLSGTRLPVWISQGIARIPRN